MSTDSALHVRCVMGGGISVSITSPVLHQWLTFVPVPLPSLCALRSVRHSCIYLVLLCKLYYMWTLSSFLTIFFIRVIYVNVFKMLCIPPVWFFFSFFHLAVWKDQNKEKCENPKYVFVCVKLLHIFSFCHMYNVFSLNDVLHCQTVTCMTLYQLLAAMCCADNHNGRCVWVRLCISAEMLSWKKACPTKCNVKQTQSVHPLFNKVDRL